MGLAILGPLRELDEVAYLRFASVYRAFDSLEDFEKEIAELRPGTCRPAPRRCPACSPTSRPARRRGAGRAAADASPRTELSAATRYDRQSRTERGASPAAAQHDQGEPPS